MLSTREYPIPPSVIFDESPTKQVELTDAQLRTLCSLAEESERVRAGRRASEHHLSGVIVAPVGVGSQSCTLAVQNDVILRGVLAQSNLFATTEGLTLKTGSPTLALVEGLDSCVSENNLGHLILGAISPAFEAFGGTPCKIDPAEERRGETWLQDALRQLDDLPTEAIEEGFTQPSHETVSRVKWLLKKLDETAGNLPLASIYPTEEGEIAIQIPKPGSDASILIVCSSSLGGACYSFISGKSCRARYDDIEDLFYDFISAQIVRIVTS